MLQKLGPLLDIDFVCGVAASNKAYASELPIPIFATHLVRNNA